MGGHDVIVVDASTAGCGEPDFLKRAFAVVDGINDLVTDGGIDIHTLFSVEEVEQ